MSQSAHAATPRAALVIGALGVVYGDIGTSPLYTLRACMMLLQDFSPDTVLGVLSLLFWMLMIVVSLKYVMLILRADNRGEGGTLALLELALRGRGGRLGGVLTGLGIFGAALFYGDSMITPAISVMSALEGIGVVSHTLDDWVVPLSLAVLVLLFAVQSHGTAAMGRLFGPVMIVWFLTLAALGIAQIVEHPQVLQALDPRWALRFVARDPWTGFILLSAVVLALTGAEALYADMGHFGRPAIRRAWFVLVLPALTLCYFGQGALLLMDASAIRNPFFLMAPGWAQWPLVVLATIATIVASQAVISGAYSVTRQAVQLGFWPRMDIQHTSAREQGQVYLPQVNRLLLVAVIALVLLFGSSEALASAYGFAVTGTMLVTTILAFAVLAHGTRGWRRVAWWTVLGFLLVLDLLLFGANAAKMHEGGWMPLTVGLVIFTLMMTWRRGRAILTEIEHRDRLPVQEFMVQLETYPPARVDGTAVFMSMREGVAPPALLHNLKHNQVLHEHVLFLTVCIRDVPYADPQERLRVDKLSASSWQAVVYYGFMEEPDVPRALEEIAQHHSEIALEPMRTSYFLSRETIVLGKKAGAMPRWLARLYAFMARNATRSTRFYRIPPNRVVEMGIQVEL